MLAAEAGMCARRRTYLLLLRQKKGTKEKATLATRSLLRFTRPNGKGKNSLRTAPLKQLALLIHYDEQMLGAVRKGK